MTKKEDFYEEIPSGPAVPNTQIAATVKEEERVAVRMMDDCPLGVVGYETAEGSKYRIVWHDKLASIGAWYTEDEAIEYIYMKPWELIMTVSAGIAEEMFNERIQAIIEYNEKIRKETENGNE